ncbi:hypothetical protein EXIGLDRAFT_166958 [Exidia glandulosa HHB12029]|uniref:RNA polymerase II elongation factor ELL N-terminal domain-containing protein n=1 Tax=Exidia glandulosa HHB12029 TaxID=1314781 RepID=A0A165N5E8_EXIGL|nr:hypothetical protein EXIGLDRAFT_166958 [Exidia glandulosa HHB12029]
MPLNFDGQVALSSQPTAGSTGLKRAMLVRLSEESLDALSADLALGKYPDVKFEFGRTPGITIGDQVFPLLAQHENAPHELYRRRSAAVTTSTRPPPAPGGLRIFGTVTGSFRVQRGTELTKRAQDKLRDTTALAEQEKGKRHAIFLDSVEPPTTTKKRKVATGAQDNGTSKPASSRDSRRVQPSTSTPLSSAPPSAASISHKASRVAPSRAAELDARPSSSVARPKLAKTAAAPPMRSRDGETLTSTFRGGVLARETKDKKPVAKGSNDKFAADAPPPKASSSKMKSAKDWDGEPDDIPLAMVAKGSVGGAKTANGRVGITSSASSTSVALAKARETAGTPSGSKARESLPGSGRKTGLTNGSGHSSVQHPVNGSAAASARPSAASSRKTTQECINAKRKRPIDDGDDEYAPGSRKPTQKTTQKTTVQKPAHDAAPAKRKRAIDDGDEEYLGPGSAKKRKSVAPTVVEPPAPSKLSNGVTVKKEPVIIKKSPRPSPVPTPAPAPPPPVTRLPNAHADRQLAGLKFKKEEKKPVLLPTPDTSMTSVNLHPSLPARPSMTSNGSSSRMRRRSTPQFTSDEDDDDEAEEGEVRPAKKSKTAHAAAASTVPATTWRPQTPLPTDHAALRARYSETYVEYTSCQHVLAMQRHLLTRRIELEDGEVDSAEMMDETALEKFKAHHALVVEELQNIRKVLEAQL